MASYIVLKDFRRSTVSPAVVAPNLWRHAPADLRTLSFPGERRRRRRRAQVAKQPSEPYTQLTRNMCYVYN